MREIDTGTMDPTSELDWKFDWGAWLKESGDTILTYALAAENVVIDDDTHDDTTVTVWLKAPTPGALSASVRCWITTQHGRYEPRTLRLHITDR